MKQKHANRPDWSRIIKRRYAQVYLQEEGYDGYVACLFLDKVSDPLDVKYGDEEVRIVDDSYAWMMFFPVNESYSLTVMLNSKDEVIQWYFDIISSMGLTSEGIPYIHDLYLDYIYLPSGTLIVKDEAELEDALRQGAISQDEYVMAIKEGAKLHNSIAANTNHLINHIHFYIRQLKRMKAAGAMKDEEDI